MRMAVLLQQQAVVDVAPAPAVAQAPAPTPAVPSVPAAPAAPVRIVVPGSGNPAQTYQAAINQRRELRRIRDGVESERRQLSQELRNSRVEGMNKAGLETRLAHLDQRILELDQQVAASEAAVASASGVAGAIPPEPPRSNEMPAEAKGLLAALFIVAVLMPMAIAHARRLWKRAGTAASAIPQSLLDRFNRLENNVDAIAIEVERMSEGQRFMTKLFAEQGGKPVGAGAAQPVEVAVRDRVSEAP